MKKYMQFSRLMTVISYDDRNRFSNFAASRMSKGRGLFSSIFKNIRQTLKSTKYQDGELVGKDPFGNKFYEVPANPRY